MEYAVIGVIALIVLVPLVRAINRPDGRQTYQRPNIQHDPCPEGSCSTGYSTGQGQRQLGMHENDRWVEQQRENATERHHAHEQAQIDARRDTWSLPVTPDTKVSVYLPGESREVPGLPEGGEWVRLNDHNWQRQSEYVERGKR